MKIITFIKYIYNNKMQMTKYNNKFNYTYEKG